MAGEGRGSSWSLKCKECNKEFLEKKDEQKHYKSQWHRYNLQRKMAGFSGVTEAVFMARQSSALDEPHSKKNVGLYTCGPCGKGYRSSKAHTTQVMSQDDFDFDEGSDGSREKKLDRYARTINHMKIDGVSSDDEDLDEDEDEVDPTCCFMCDRKHETIESCMIHLHKQHGLFIPDIEYLIDPEGLLTYLGEKVKRDYTCLYCNINCQPFESLEAVRMHMVAKSHCRVHYGDGTDEDEEPELDEFYDYSSSYADGNGKQLVTCDGMSNSVTLGCGGSELIISRATDDGISTKAIGSREYLRYYRQKPHPSPDSVCVTALQAARNRSMSLATLQLKEKMERMNLMKQIMKQMNRSRAESMQCKMSMMRCNPIRNLRPINALH